MVNYTFSLYDFEKFLLIVVRVASFLFIAPPFHQRGVPSRVKIGLAVFISILIGGMIDMTQVEYTGMIGYALIVLKEGITGLMIGLAANICNSIILFAGNIIDMDIGLSMATMFDPSTNSQVTISGNLYNYFILLLLLATDMHHTILRAIMDCFNVIPINGQVFRWDSLMTTMTNFLGDMFVIAFRIVLPIFVCIMILNCILGIMAKVAPQMNIFAVGMQMKIVLGFAVLFITSILLGDVGNFIFREIQRMMVSVIKGLY